MADRINYRFPEMRSTVSEVDSYSEQYKSAADKLLSDVLAAVASWEGESKERFVYFLQNPVYEHIHETIPKIVNVVARQIEMSANAMSETDAELAANIPQSLGG